MESGPEKVLKGDIEEVPEMDVGEIGLLPEAVTETLPDRGIGILPVVVWQSIIKNSSADVGYSLSQTCQDLQNLVIVKKPAYLLSPTDIGLVSSYLGRDEILNARRVCHFWNRSIDTNLENTRPLNQTPDSSSQEPLAPIHSKRFSSVQGIEDFMVAAHRHPKNPFIGRAVEFSDDNQDGQILFWASAFQVIERFGTEIFHISIDFNPSSSNFICQTLPVLRQMFVLMPNLKTLRLSENGRQWDDFDFEEQVIEFFKRNPQPRIKALEEIHEMTKIPSCIILEVLKSLCVSQNLKRLKIHSRKFYRGFEFPNIYWLQMTVRESVDLEYFRMITCSPRFISVSMDSNFRGSRLFHMRRVLEFLEPLGGKLEKLYLELEVKMLDGFNARPLAFPLLRIITVNELGGIVRLFPTLPVLQTVKILEDMMVVPFSEYGGENVSPYEGEFVAMDLKDNKGLHPNITELKIAESGFWTRLNQLQQVQFPNKTYSRP